MGLLEAGFLETLEGTSDKFGDISDTAGDASNISDLPNPELVPNNLCLESRLPVDLTLRCIDRSSPGLSSIELKNRFINNELFELNWLNSFITKICLIGINTKQNSIEYSYCSSSLEYWTILDYSLCGIWRILINFQCSGFLKNLENPCDECEEVGAEKVETESTHENLNFLIRF